MQIVHNSTPDQNLTIHTNTPDETTPALRPWSTPCVQDLNDAAQDTEKIIFGPEGSLVTPGS